MKYVYYEDLLTILKEYQIINKNDIVHRSNTNSYIIRNPNGPCDNAISIKTKNLDNEYIYDKEIISKITLEIRKMISLIHHWSTNYCSSNDIESKIDRKKRFIISDHELEYLELSSDLFGFWKVYDLLSRTQWKFYF